MVKKYYNIEVLDEEKIRNLKWFIYSGLYPYNEFKIDSSLKFIINDSILNYASLNLLLINFKINEFDSTLKFNVIYLVQDSIDITCFHQFINHKYIEIILGFKNMYCIFDKNNKIFATKFGTLKFFESLIIKGKSFTKLEIEYLYHPWLKPEFREYILNNQSKLHPSFRLEAMKRGYLPMDYFYVIQEKIPWLEKVEKN